ITTNSPHLRVYFWGGRSTLREKRFFGYDNKRYALDRSLIWGVGVENLYDLSSERRTCGSCCAIGTNKRASWRRCCGASRGGDTIGGKRRISECWDFTNRPNSRKYTRL